MAGPEDKKPVITREALDAAEELADRQIGKLWRVPFLWVLGTTALLSCALPSLAILIALNEGAENACVPYLVGLVVIESAVAWWFQRAQEKEWHTAVRKALAEYKDRGV